MALALQFLAIAALFQVVDGVQSVACGALRGYHDTRVPMLIAALGYWGIGFIGGWTLAFPLGLGPAGLWWGFVIGLAAVAMLLLLRLIQRGRGWREFGRCFGPSQLLAIWPRGTLDLKPFVQSLDETLLAVNPLLRLQRENRRNPVRHFPL